MRCFWQGAGRRIHMQEVGTRDGLQAEAATSIPDEHEGKLATAAALIAGNVMYKDGLNVLVRPGQRVAFNVRTAVTGVCGVRAFMWVEPSWEVPGNTTGVFTTT